MRFDVPPKDGYLLTRAGVKDGRDGVIPPNPFGTVNPADVGPGLFVFPINGCIPRLGERLSPFLHLLLHFEKIHGRITGGEKAGLVVFWIFLKEERAEFALLKATESYLLMRQFYPEVLTYF